MENYVIYNWNGQVTALVEVQRNDKHLSLDANTFTLFLNANFF